MAEAFVFNTGKIADARQRNALCMCI